MKLYSNGEQEEEMGKGIRAPHLPVYIYLCTRVRFCPELLLRVCPFLLA